MHNSSCLGLLLPFIKGHYLNKLTLICCTHLSCVSFINVCQHFLLPINVLEYTLKMPYYAVAVGRLPGVYTNWIECENQTKGFPKPIYRKFNTESEAWNFVRSQKNLLSKNVPYVKTTSILLDNRSEDHQTLNVLNTSIGTSNKDTLSLIAEKLDAFIEQTKKKLGEFSNRLDSLETKVFSRNDTDCKRKVICVNDSNEDGISKKQKVPDIKSITEVSSGIRQTRSKSNVTDEVEGPSHWAGDYQPSGQGFIMDASEHVIVYTDGACSNNGKDGAKAGIGVWFNHNNPFNVAAPVEGNATNNNAEIQAATRAIEQASLAGLRNINIHTDSQFMINCMTKWIPKWKQNNWKTVNGASVKNKEQLVLLDNAIETMDSVQWTHVRGHMGCEGNECADALARSAATMYK